jgi:hypothetical protein
MFNQSGRVKTVIIHICRRTCCIALPPFAAPPSSPQHA